MNKVFAHHTIQKRGIGASFENFLKIFYNFACRSTGCIVYGMKY